MALGDFSTQAEAYGRSRPGYPLSLIVDLIDDAGVVRGDAVADFGAGTGIMTRILVNQGFVVSAVEPNESMRRQADVPDARWIAGTFEGSGLESSSQRWAMAAQAFHWADPKRCLPEIRRVLQPGCLFTVLWNNRAPEENDIIRWTEDAIRRHVPDFDEAYRDFPTDKVLESTGDFRFINHRKVTHTISMSRERYLALWKSHNRLNTIAGPARFAIFFNELQTYLERQPSDLIDVRYECDAWSARRND